MKKFIVIALVIAAMGLFPKETKRAAVITVNAGALVFDTTAKVCGKIGNLFTESKPAKEIRKRV